MKKCPTCNQVYSDDTNFCLNDGMSLIPISYPEEVPTRVLSHPLAMAPVQTGGTSKWLYLVIGVMGVALVLAIAAIALFMFWPRNTIERSDAVNKTANTDPSPKPTETFQGKPGLTFNANPSNVPQTNTYLSPSGRWSGNWTSKTTAFSAEANFTETDGNVSGQIVWTIQRTSNPKKMDKIGTTAVEYVRGTFNPQTQMLDVNGYRKDDPNNIIILDKYHLSLAANNQTITGKSINGQFTLRR